MSTDLASVERDLATLAPTSVRGLEIAATRALSDIEDARDAAQETLPRALAAAREGRIPLGVPLGASVYATSLVNDPSTEASVLHSAVQRLVPPLLAALTVAACAPERTMAPEPLAPAFAGGPTAPVAAGRIFFESCDQVDPFFCDLYVINADGSGRTRLTSDAADENEPTLSPDGTRLLYWANPTGNYEIFTLNLDGSGVTQLTNHPANDERADWSANGRSIVFTSDRDGDFEIHVMNADGSGVTQLTFNTDPDGGPAFSPDGRSIAFHSARDGNFEIYVMDRTGSNQTNITNFPGSDRNPAWSPNGRRIAFESRRGAETRLWVMNREGSAPTPLASAGRQLHPTWSFDEQWIAFVSDQNGTDFELFRIRPDGTGVAPIITIPNLDEFFPSWHPPGR